MASFQDLLLIRHVANKNISEQLALWLCVIKKMPVKDVEKLTINNGIKSSKIKKLIGTFNSTLKLCDSVKALNLNKCDEITHLCNQILISDTQVKAKYAVNELLSAFFVNGLSVEKKGLELKYDLPVDSLKHHILRVKPLVELYMELQYSDQDVCYKEVSDELKMDIRELVALLQAWDLDV